MFNVILYYNFTRLNHPEDFCQSHKKYCRGLGLKGRVYIAHEGINGTLAGSVAAIDEYKRHLTSLAGFERTEFKEELYTQIPFVKLTVKARPEIVTLKADVDVDPTKEKGAYLEPKEWRKALESGEDHVLLDVRNNYESRIGRFEGALTPDVENFYDFPQWLMKMAIPKEKKVLMYCTGGIRCEKFSLYMKKKGFNKVYQLHGGIINYKHKENGAHYQGKCFVFDDRLAVPVEEPQKRPLARCAITGVPCDTYLNCANPDCNKLFICSEEGAKQMEGCCSAPCRQSPRRKPFNPDNIYEPTRKRYTYLVKSEW
jgi:UPF0176 protein